MCQPLQRTAVGSPPGCTIAPIGVVAAGSSTTLVGSSSPSAGSTVGGHPTPQGTSGGESSLTFSGLLFTFSGLLSTFSGLLFTFCGLLFTFNRLYSWWPPQGRPKSPVSAQGTPTPPSIADSFPEARGGQRLQEAAPSQAQGSARDCDTL